MAPRGKATTKPDATVLASTVDAKSGTFRANAEAMGAKLNEVLALEQMEQMACLSRTLKLHFL